MRDKIMAELAKIEDRENVKILLAVESGSRAWGFASTDSDYDVRFIYVRQTPDYLKLNPVRDVIEVPINDMLDINGWDLQKTLRLLYKSNPTVFEWFSSPIIYRETDFADRFRKIMNQYFARKKGLYHYLSMAKGNYREYLKTDMVRVKKYFYVIRPVLACRWILDNKTNPPMLFSELVAAELPANLKSTIDRLLAIKMNSPEIKEIPRVDILNEFIETSIESIQAELETVKDSKDADWKELDNIFLKELGCGERI